MNSFDNYQLEDFIQDLSFRRWVQGKLSAQNKIWENWILRNPGKSSLVEEARSLVLASQIEEIAVSELAVRQGIEKILKSTGQKHSYRKAYLWTGIAASVILVLSLYGLVKPQAGNPLSEGDKDIVKTENNGAAPLNLQLSDGSTVILKKGSRLQVSNDFNKSSRTVYLSGEAFFEVEKNPQRPFIVHAGGIVTKVLGTSFNVRAYEGESKTLVAVHTGRVTVYQDQAEDRLTKTYPEQIVLTPNQQVVFEKTQEKLVKTLIKAPVILVEKVQSIYEEVAITRVFADLEDAYGVKIVYDVDVLAKCNLTASFEKETLYEKIEIICETIHARYEIADGQIVVYAKGCE